MVLVAGVSAIVADDDGYGIAGVGPESPLVRVVGESDACSSQMVDQLGGPRGCDDLGCALPRVVLGLVLACEQDGQGGQVGHDLVLADVQVLRSAGVRAGGAGVAVAAPVGCGRRLRLAR